MQKTRLFHTLVLFGASLTGGAVATVATVSAVAVAGCDDTSTNTDLDMAIGHYFDIGVPFVRDLAQNDDLSQHD